MLKNVQTLNLILGDNMSKLKPPKLPNIHDIHIQSKGRKLPTKHRKTKYIKIELPLCSCRCKKFKKIDEDIFECTEWHEELELVYYWAD